MLRYLKRIKGWLLERKRQLFPPFEMPHSLEQPQIKCQTAYHGTAYGGWTLCPDRLSSENIIYSFGIGEDASFDLSVIEAYGSQVYAFDPTPRSINWVQKQKWPSQFHFYPLGIAAQGGFVQFRPPENPDYISHTLLERSSTNERAIQVEVQRLSTIAKMRNHEAIDVLKMDIEGAEYQVLQDILDRSDIEIGQILVEFHHMFPNVHLKQTYQAIQKLNNAGYQIFHVSENGREYSFIKYD